LPIGNFYLVADGYGTSPTNKGSFTLGATSSVANNDTCGTALAIPTSGTYLGTTIGKSNNFTAPSCATMGGLGADVVYSITPKTTTIIGASLCGTAWDTVLYVSTTCGFSSTACDDDFCGAASGSQVSFTAFANTTYYLVIDGYNAADGGA